MSQLLLELFSEEIPASMQLPAAKELKIKAEERLAQMDIGYSSVDTFVTPRRLTLVIEGLPTKQKDTVEEKRGPRTDAPAKAVEGFLKSTGLLLKQLQKRPTPKGEFYFAVIERKGQDVSTLLSAMLEEIIAGFTWPKSMKWGTHSIRWVRPLHNIMCLFGGKVLPATFGHLTANDQSFGHRFMKPDSFTVENFEQYKKALADAFVILCSQERQQLIISQAEALAKSKDLLVKKDPKLLEEVTGLVEYPEVLLGRIEEEFMQLPEEVLTTAMRSHQKYFSLRSADGDMAPYFITVSNIQTADNGKKIIHGNEKVLKARLDDAQFFWDQDSNQTLESNIEALEKVVFHAKLGTVAEKTSRITALAKLFAVWVPRANLILVERAAQLCKADLTTQMVGEFPELQGLMGSYYALDNGEDPEVAAAIKEHYSPQGPGDMCPTAPLSVAVALADKIDTLAGLFLVNQKPTGSRDPYALRRAALGVIRIILENKLRVPLRLMFEKAIKQYPKSAYSDDNKPKRINPLKGGKERSKKQVKVVDELLHFFVERFRSQLRDNDVRYDLIDAVFNEGQEDDLTRMLQRISALECFIKTSDGENLCIAYKRANNILEAEEKKDGTVYDSTPDKDLLVEDEEFALYQIFKEIKPSITRLLKEENFSEVMTQLSRLRQPIDLFFDGVVVNVGDEDIRRNRLLLLSQFRSALKKVANFGHIES